MQVNEHQVRTNKELAEREYLEGKIVLNSLPSKIIIYCTDACNLRCVMCNIGIGKGDTIAISKHGLDRIFDIFPILDRVAFTGAEVFFDRGNPASFVQKIIHEGDKYPQIKYGGVTNGTLINQQKAQLIVDKFDWLSVSIDSPDPEKYKAIRVGANLKSVRENLAQIRNLKTTRGLKNFNFPVISLNFLMMKQTYPDLIRMVEFSAEVGAQAIQLQIPYKGSIPLNEDLFEDQDSTRKFLSLRSDAERLAEKLKIKIIDRTQNTIISNFPQLLERSPHDSDRVLGKYPKHCRIPYDEIYIDAHGNVRFCCTSLVVIGNINRSSIQEIWNSPSAIRMRRNLVKGDYSMACMQNCVRGYKLPNHIDISSPKYYLKKYFSILSDMISSSKL